MIRLTSSLRTLLLGLAIAVAAACAPAAPRTGAEGPAPGPGPSKTLRIGIRVEPTTIAAKSPGLGGGVTLETTRRLFNANLTINDSSGVVLPYLAENLPQLSTDSWRVFPDGRMETIYRLKPDLVWHDGAPLSALDFVFSWQAYSVPELGVATTAPTGFFEEVVALDERTVLIRWQRPYPDAGILSAGFPPLPRHILEAPLRETPPDAFAGHSYWTRDYVGLGPYRLAQWEPGAFIEGVAFERHVWGRPQIDRVRISFFPDPNTAMANLLSGELDLLADDAIFFGSVAPLKQQWGSTGGRILLAPQLFRSVSAQLRPELASPPAILDVRVRKALAHTTDKQAVNDLLFEGEGIMADLPIPPGPPYYAQLEQTIEKFPHDLRRAQQLMADAGYLPGADGLFAGTEGRLTLEIKTNATSDQEREMTVLAAGWRRAGFDFREAVNPAALAQNNEVRATFSSLFAYSGGGFTESGFAGYTTARIPSAANRWQGGNRGGWSNREFDRLADQLTASLDRAERDRLIMAMAQIFTADLPLIPLHFPPHVVAHLPSLGGTLPYIAQGTFSWNAHQWQLR
jgi:peptide/nickel transport system substrate-binding protein